MEAFRHEESPKQIPCYCHVLFFNLLFSCSVVSDSTVAHQGLLSMGFSGQDYWSGLPFPHPGNLPDPGI